MRKFEQHQANLKNLVNTIQNTPETKLANLLMDLLTPQEIVNLGERIEIIKRLKQWKTQRTVSQEMNISVTTVNRGARVIKFGSWVLEQHVK